jgi:Uma2 family endonuclease
MMSVDLGPLGRPMTDDEFFEFCQVNRKLRIERTREGDIIVMPPAGGESGRRNLEVSAALLIWAKADKTGIAFDSSTGFLLPNGAEYSPDAAWVRREQWDALSQQERERFPPLCPNFVIEIRSRTDRLARLQEKMQDYINNGAELGWLIDPLERKVYVYRPGVPTDCLDNPESISADPVLPGFTLNLIDVFA